MSVGKEFSKQFSKVWVAYRSGGPFNDFVASFRALLRSSGPSKRNDFLSIAKTVVTVQMSTTPPTDGHNWTQKNFALQRDYLKAARATLCDADGSVEANLLLCATRGKESTTNAVLEEHELTDLQHELQRLFDLDVTDLPCAEPTAVQLKVAGNLALRGFAAFPSLASVAVPSASVERFLDRLMEAGAWTAAIGLVVRFNSVVGTAQLRRLLQGIAQDREPDKALEVLACARRLAAQNAQTTRTGARSVHKSLGGEAEDVPLSQLREADAQALAEWFISCCRDANTRASLRSAVSVAGSFRLGPLKEKVKEQATLRDLDESIARGKWRIQAQLCERKGLQRRVALYERLLLRGLYHEAHEVAELLRLKGKVVPVDVDQLEAQDRRNAATYLQLPLPLGQVLCVRDLRSLRRAAEYLLVPLTHDLDPAAVPEDALWPMSVPDLVKRANPTGDGAREAVVGALTGRYRSVVGLDAEWGTRVFQDLTHLGASTLQIATADAVIILFFRELLPESPLPTGPGDPRALQYYDDLKVLTRRLVGNLLLDPTVLKVGWDFGRGDLIMLRNNSKGWFAPALGRGVASYVELSALCALLPRVRGGPGSPATQPHRDESIGDGRIVGESSAEAFSVDDVETSPADPEDSDDLDNPLEDDGVAEAGAGSSSNNNTTTAATSLSGACAAFLGRPLLKSEQMSDWDRPQLTEKQVRYAALDAHATLALLDRGLEVALGAEGPVDLGGAAKHYRQQIQKP